jgi:D-serine deaminase-like pyridoxal phosphate-dependent protein
MMEAMPNLGPNAPLINVAGSRQALDTPALVVDLDALERNIAGMAAHARAVGVALRPHAKTHKSMRIAEMQVAAGALGVCCATLGEAEVMVAGGIPGVHITSPQVTPSKITRRPFRRRRSSRQRRRPRPRRVRREKATSGARRLLRRPSPHRLPR